MDLLDETFACDSEFLDAFSTRSWLEASIALSMALSANVEFPEQEDLPPDDTRTGFALMVYRSVCEYEYPMSIRDFLVNVLDMYDTETCVESWRELTDVVEWLERIRVTIGRQPFAPADTWDDYHAGDYRFRRAAPGTWTVARWRNTRLTACLPTHAIASVNYPDGSPVPGQTRLATLRRAWADQPSTSWPDPTDPTRLFELMRDARWIGYVRSVMING